MKYFSAVGLFILMPLFICYAEASPTRPRPPVTRTKHFSCPRNIRMICPTEKKHFVVHSSWSWSRFGCKLEESIAEAALKECNNSVIDICKERWEKKLNDCSVPIPVVKEVVVDYLFQGACFLHNLCYLSRNTKRKDCDDWFLHNMKKTCSVRMLTRPFCVASAYTVNLAARGFGRTNFEKAKNWTKANCTLEKPEGKPPTEGPIRDSKPTTEGHTSFEGSGTTSFEGSGTTSFEGSGTTSFEGSGTKSFEGSGTTSFEGSGTKSFEGSGTTSFEGSGSGSEKFGSGFEPEYTGRTMQPDKWSSEQTLEQIGPEQADEKSTKPEMIEFKYILFPNMQNEQPPLKVNA